METTDIKKYGEFSGSDGCILLLLVRVFEVTTVGTGKTALHIGKLS